MKRAIAIGCHPDDIEFNMAGTLLLLQREGYEIHYMNLADGSLGGEQYGREELAAIRRDEAIAAATQVGAIWHRSICSDMEVFYNVELLGELLPVIREVSPEIILTHGPYDYMEDHINTGRLAVGAAFARGMGNAITARYAAPIQSPVAVYHCASHAFGDMLNRPVKMTLFTDITATLKTKKEMLQCHRSQKEWLDITQGMDAYLDDMAFRAEFYGQESGEFRYAEGWNRHNPLGLSAPDFDPLTAVLSPKGLIRRSGS
ncbi:PIG-L deacetylase family protein [Victivallis vadensis]|uniref:PIG-L deacetylase family protein n=1 Tax=Victivallis vadensis TaxID=172901 RepID=UPI003AF7EA40